MLRGHKPSEQRGASVHSQDREHGFCRPLHYRDDPEVDCLRPLAILHQRLDLPGLRHRLRE